MKKILLYLLLIPFFGFIVSCEDPPDPPPDDVTDPPDPPELIQPQADTTFNGDTVQVYFDWTYLDGAQIYEIQVDTLLTFSTGTTYSSYAPPMILELHRYGAVTMYCCRIRAASEYWTYYTDWSEQRRFYLKPDP